MAQREFESTFYDNIVCHTTRSK